MPVRARPPPPKHKIKRHRGRTSEENGCYSLHIQNSKQGLLRTSQGSGRAKVIDVASCSNDNAHVSTIQSVSIPAAGPTEASTERTCTCRMGA
jgi:hypothetical protein